MDGLRVAYVENIIVAVFAWVLTLAPIGGLVYVVATSGGVLEQNDLIVMGALVFVVFVAVVFFSGIGGRVLNHRLEFVEDLYDRYSQGAGYTTLHNSAPRYDRAVSRFVQVSWRKGTSQPERVFIDGIRLMPVEAMRELLELLNKKAGRGARYVMVVDSDTAEFNDTLIVRCSTSDSSYRHRLEIQEAILQLREVLDPLSEEIYGRDDSVAVFNPELRDGVVIGFTVRNTNDYSRTLESRESYLIEQALNRAVSPPETFSGSGDRDYTWRSSNSTSGRYFYISDDSDNRLDDNMLKTLWKAVYASLKVSGSQASISDIMVYSVADGAPVDLDVELTNFDDLNDRKLLSKMANGLVRVVEHAYGGQWAVFDNLSRNSIGLRMDRQDG